MKIVKNLYYECIGHLKTCGDSLASCRHRTSSVEQTLNRIRHLMCSHRNGSDCHGPIFVRGPDGCGKTTILSAVFASCLTWFQEADDHGQQSNNNNNNNDNNLVRIVRYLGLDPAVTYMPLLIQDLYAQISLAFNLSTAQIHPNMDLPELCVHLQTVVDMLSKNDSGGQLLLVLDDVHMLKHPRFIDVVQNGFLPWTLPPNVHLVCSVGEVRSSEDDRLLQIIESHYMTRNQILDGSPQSSSDLLSSSLDTLLTATYSRTVTRDQKQWLLTTCCQCKEAGNPLLHQLLLDDASRWTSSTKIPDINGEVETSSSSSLESIIRMLFRNAENRLGKHAVSRFAQHLCCSLYGLTEAEIVQLMYANQDDIVIQSSATIGRTCSTNVTSWCAVKNSFGNLLRETQVGCRPLLAFRHRCIADVAARLYLHQQQQSGGGGNNDRVARAVHSDIAASLFVARFITSATAAASTASDVVTFGGGRLHRASTFDGGNDDDGGGDAWNNGDRIDLRHIDQLWYHLLQAKDIVAVKRVVACNFQFLFAALCTVSVRYVLCILDVMRSQILDYEIELLYHVIEFSMDVLCKNPLQFAPVIISWLRFYKALSIIEAMVSQAMEWCDTHEEPLLVPLNTWVWKPLPEEAMKLNCPKGISCFVLSHDNQMLICGDFEKAIHLYCLPSKRQTKTLAGHYGKVVCLHISHTGKYLLSGSEDTTTIVWDIQASSIKHRISEHIATVTCVATTLNDTLIVSGSEDSRVLIADMETGKVVYKLEHHRGMISCLFVANDIDVLITGAADCAVCVWSLDNFSLLNSLSFPSPVVNMDVSNDRTFLLVACEDNSLYLRSVTTGSEIHTISGHNSPVLSVCIANDNCRALIGCENHQVYMYDLHTSKLLRTFGGHDAAVTGVRVTANDGFLFTAGGDLFRVWYLGPSQDESAHHHHQGKESIKKSEHHSDVILCVDISKDGTLGISGSADFTVKVWQLSNSELHSTLEAHTAPVTCVACASNGLFAVSGSSDKTVRVWGLTLGHIVSAFKEHGAAISAVKVTSDSRKVLSADISGYLKLWQADNGTVVLSCRGPSSYVDVTTNMKYAICGGDDNSVHIWTLSQDDKKHTVSHKDAVLCHALTFDSRHLITGSRDKSLKVWDVMTGRLTQVLVGHLAAVTCVDVAPLNRVLVVSGSEDCNLIVWDMQTGHEVHTLSCHTDVVTCVQLTVDGHTTVSGSIDKTIIVWETQSGQLVTLFNMHYTILNLAMSFDAGHILVHLKDFNKLPLLCLHNCPPIDIQAYLRLEKAMEKESSLQAALPRKVHRRILQKEMSLDTYTWAKKYGHFPGKQHSFSSSLEDFTMVAMSPISSSTQNLHNLVSQSKTNLNQSTTFDELQAVWDGTDPTESRPQTPTNAALTSARRDQSISSMSSLASTDLLAHNGGHGTDLPDILTGNGEDRKSLLSAENVGAGYCVIM